VHCRLPLRSAIGRSSLELKTGSDDEGTGAGHEAGGGGSGTESGTVGCWRRE